MDIEYTSFILREKCYTQLIDPDKDAPYQYTSDQWMRYLKRFVSFINCLSPSDQDELSVLPPIIHFHMFMHLLQNKSNPSYQAVASQFSKINYEETQKELERRADHSSPFSILMFEETRKELERRADPCRWFLTQCKMDIGLYLEDDIEKCNSIDDVRRTAYKKFLDYKTIVRLSSRSFKKLEKFLMVKDERPLLLILREHCKFLVKKTEYDRHEKIVQQLEDLVEYCRSKEIKRGLIDSLTEATETYAEGYKFKMIDEHGKIYGSYKPLIDLVLKCVLDGTEQIFEADAHVECSRENTIAEKILEVNRDITGDCPIPMDTSNEIVTENAPSATALCQSDMDEKNTNKNDITGDCSIPMDTSNEIVTENAPNATALCQSDMDEKNTNKNGSKGVSSTGDYPITLELLLQGSSVINLSGVSGNEIADDLARDGGCPTFSKEQNSRQENTDPEATGSTEPIYEDISEGESDCDQEKSKTT